MPPPWCFFWLPTIVSMEWLRTRMALYSRRGQGTGDSRSAPCGADNPKPPRQPQVLPGPPPELVHTTTHPSHNSSHRSVQPEDEPHGHDKVRFFPTRC